VGLLLPPLIAYLPPGGGLLPITPQSYPSEQACFVGNNLYVLAWLKGDFFCVAAAEIEMIPVKQLEGLIDRLLQQLVPALLPVFVEAAASEIVLVFAIPLPWMVSGHW
jgi:hypothetical protein